MQRRELSWSLLSRKSSRGKRGEKAQEAEAVV